MEGNPAWERAPGQPQSFKEILENGGSVDQCLELATHDLRSRYMLEIPGSVEVKLKKLLGPRMLRVLNEDMDSAGKMSSLNSIVKEAAMKLKGVKADAVPEAVWSGVKTEEDTSATDTDPAKPLPPLAVAGESAVQINDADLDAAFAAWGADEPLQATG
jgi:hypothetical protein